MIECVSVRRSRYARGPCAEDESAAPEVMMQIDFARVLKTALAKGGDYADVYLERNVSRSILCEDDRLEKVVSGVDSGAGVRIIFGSRSAYAYSNDVSEASLLELARVASMAVRSAEGTGGAAVSLRLREPSVDHPIRILPESVGTRIKVEAVQRANRAAASLDRRVRQVLVVHRESRQEVTVAGSDGTLSGDDRVYLTAFVQVVTADDHVVQTGYESIGGLTGMELFEDQPLEEAAVRAARRAVMMLGARKAPAGRMPVVLSSDAGGTMIHEAVGHGLEADLAQSGLSVYSGKIGQQIASPLITVLDDSTLRGKRGSFRFDDEGTAARRTLLVERGVLKTFLYDRLTAARDGRVSTGNGRRESYRHRPIPRMSNTMIAPGESDPAGILRSTERGLFVTKMGGGQVNTVNGDFVFEVNEGYLIDKGVIGEPVRGASLIGNGPQVLLSIDRVGSDLGFSLGTCGKDGQGAPVSDAQPTIRIPEITVGGEVG